MRSFLAVFAFLPVMHAEAVLGAGPPTATLDASNRLVVAFPIVNQGSAAVAGVQVSAISLAGATLMTPLPVKVGAIAANGRATLAASFSGDALTPGGTYLLKIAGSFAEGARTVPFAIEHALQIPNSAASSSTANTTSGARNPHEPPNFADANPSRALVVPTGPQRDAPGSPESSARPPTESSPVKFYANASVGFSPNRDLKPVKVKGLWGYADASGAIKIPPKFAEAAEFYNRFARVKSGSKYGLISESGAFALQPVFAGMAEAASERFAAVQPVTGGGWGFADVSTGKLAIPARFTMALPFHEGLAAVSVRGKWGYIDTSGALKIPSQFDEAGPFVNGIAQVTVGKRSRQINLLGAFVK